MFSSVLARQAAPMAPLAIEVATPPKVSAAETGGTKKSTVPAMNRPSLVEPIAEPQPASLPPSKPEACAVGPAFAGRTAAVSRAASIRAVSFHGSANGRTQRPPGLGERHGQDLQRRGRP